MAHFAELWEKSPEPGQKVSCLERLLHQLTLQSPVIGTRKSQEGYGMFILPLGVDGVLYPEQKFWLVAVCGALSYEIVMPLPGVPLGERLVT